MKSSRSGLCPEAFKLSTEPPPSPQCLGKKTELVKQEKPLRDKSHQQPSEDHMHLPQNMSVITAQSKRLSTWKSRKINYSSHSADVQVQICKSFTHVYKGNLQYFDAKNSF